MIIRNQSTLVLGPSDPYRVRVYELLALRYFKTLSLDPKPQILVKP